MVLKKIRKSAATLTMVAISLLLVIGTFAGMFAYLNYSTDVAGKSLDSTYSSINTNLSAIQSDIKTKGDAIKDNFASVEEAQSGFIAAINGFKGVGNILLLIPSYITYGVGVLEALLVALSDMGIPIWATSLVLAGLITFLSLLILSVLKGDQQKI